MAGATPGLHYPESRFYLRRVRLSSSSELLPALKKAGYKIVPAVGDEKNTLVVEIPVDVGEAVRTLETVSMWEQLAFAAFLQAYWADNQVSCTVTFDPEVEGPQLKHALELYQYQLKGISFLPRLTMGAYPQMPYEAISEEVYKEAMRRIQKVDFNSMSSEVRDGLLLNEVPDKFCDAAGCSVISVEAHKESSSSQQRPS